MSPLEMKLEFPAATAPPPPDLSRPDSLFDAAATIAMQVFPDMTLTKITSFDSGVYNQLFELDLASSGGRSGERPILRVATVKKATSDISLESEVATMAYIKLYTTIPVPDVYAYCPNAKNPLGAPFVIISRMVGQALDVAWPQLSYDARVRVIQEYARVTSKLLQCQFPLIGSLHFGTDDSPIVLGDVSLRKMCADIRAEYEDYASWKGPWQDAAQWLKASLEDELQFMTKDSLKCQSWNDQVLVLDIDTIWPIAQRIIPELLNKWTPLVASDKWSKGPFYLGHADLSFANVMVDKDGSITGVVDWEMSSTMPLWNVVCCPPWAEDIELCDSFTFQIVYLDELGRLGLSDDIIDVARHDGWRRDYADG
ncbi:hypothetical protein EIP91_011878 [Steccherinum ochraceum]|uniref:Aminoglycoside phosphotransferase domain-containing protein n=1 Tax=Steccherinum ochraceum TaxID=92696 RepID=A0A4R0RJY5_9APHY|nr:hypothetical protein EIP91_011878 [Steccherinum ochraceum]